MEQGNINYDLYQKSPQIVLGFHGCEKNVAIKVLNSGVDHLKSSLNDYDWLGSGVYFWLNDPRRAYEWAVTQKKTNPFVLGAIIDLGACLNFTERNSIELLKKSYLDLQSILDAAGKSIRILTNSRDDDGGFKLVRKLDCAVINNIHKMIEDEGGTSFDTVYGCFQEGTAAYPEAGIREKTHIQICVRNLDCIKGYFLPRIHT